MSLSVRDWFNELRSFDESDAFPNERKMIAECPPLYPAEGTKTRASKISRVEDRLRGDGNCCVESILADISAIDWLYVKLNCTSVFATDAIANLKAVDEMMMKLLCLMRESHGYHLIAGSLVALVDVCTACLYWAAKTAKNPRAS